MGRPTSVAVIDDDTDYRQLYKLWLPEEYEVIEAGDGRTGLQRIDDSIDAVLLDRQMPKLSGETVAEKLRQRSVTPAVVMISSVKPDVDILDIPVDSYLRKPADRDTLLSVLSQFSAGANTRRSVGNSWDLPTDETQSLTLSERQRSRRATRTSGPSNGWNNTTCHSPTQRPNRSAQCIPVQTQRVVRPRIRCKTIGFSGRGTP